MDEWPSMFFGCVTGDTWQGACDTWHLTPDTWHLTPDTWHLTPDTWFFSLLFLQFFWRYFYVSATNQTGREIQCLPYAGHFLLREECKKKQLNPQACSHLLQFFLLHARPKTNIVFTPNTIFHIVSHLCDHLDQASHLKFVEFVLPLFCLVFLKFNLKSYLTSQIIQKRRWKKIT